MDRHFLVAVSEHKSALNGIRFLGNFYSDKQAVKSTLFYSSPKPPALWEDETGLAARARQKDQAKKMLAEARQALENAADKGMAMGFPKENLFQKLQESRFTAVSDIIQEGEAGHYDAVVLGRRSLGLLESAFEGSVSKSLFQQRFSFPLWLCRSVQADRKHILLYGDGSEVSYTMADHVGFVAGLENRHRVDMLLGENCRQDDTVKNRYQSVLAKHGIAGKRLHWLPAQKGYRADHILKLVKENGYAAVALGRTHPERNVFSRLLKGPVASVLFRELQDASLWVCN